MALYTEDVCSADTTRFVITNSCQWSSFDARYLIYNNKFIVLLSQQYLSNEVLTMIKVIRLSKGQDPHVHALSLSWILKKDNNINMNKAIYPFDKYEMIRGFKFI